MAIALASESEHGVGTGLDAAVDQAREMDAEERELGVGHGVDEIVNEVLRRRLELVVFASKRNDTRGIMIARHVAEAIAMKSPAINEEIGFVVSAS